MKAASFFNTLRWASVFPRACGQGEIAVEALDYAQLGALA
jgi:hypothetical protein